jgi:DNA-binding transcriptional LysR family regulator
MNSIHVSDPLDFHLDLLRSFVAVKEAGSFTGAARRLHLTQSAISHQIRRLEEQVGRTLLHRTTRSLTLTEEGHDFLGYAENVLRAVEALNLRFQRSPISGVVHFGVPESFMGNRLPSLLCQYSRAYPAVRLDVSVSTYSDLRAKVESCELDLAVVMSASDKEEAVLRDTQFVWVASETFELAEDRSVPLALSPAPCVNREVGLTALQRTPVEWHIVFTSLSQQGLRAAVSAGLAISVLTREELEPGMRIVDGEYGLPKLPVTYFTLLWSATGKTSAATEFGRMLLDVHIPGDSRLNPMKR